MQHQLLRVSIIETRNLSKTFKSFKAVDDLSFSIHTGDVYGFLGENGAGKSTTMRMLLGLIYPDCGEILIEGQKFDNGNRHLLASIGAIIERPDMYGYLSGWDNLKIFAALSNKDIKEARLYEVLEIVGLRGREQDKFKAYSQGMKQRLGIAVALVHSPKLLILDEPTNGLDPQGIAEMRSLILSLSRDHGKTILISSHLLYEIEQVASRMLIIHKGKKMVEGNVQDLLNPEETLVDIRCTTDAALIVKLNNTQWKERLVNHTPNTLTLKMNTAGIPELNKWLVSNEVPVLSINSKHSLEAYFLSLTNDEATAHRTV
ncbi:MAG TPA: ABC transporter ATP-binding protein [Flavipsychrobacter sp.]|nr:ABC transporter ATP-binding protein [Flavipsychrobacter sp.]